MTLYEIQADMLDVLSEVEEQGGEITEEQEARLDALSLSRNEKIENWVKYLKNLASDEAGLTAEIDELSRRRDRLRRHRDYSKSSLSGLLGYGETWKKSPHSLSWRSSFSTEPRMPLEDMREIFVRISEKREFNKVAAKEFILSNGPIPEAEIVEKRTLQIK